MPHITFKFVRLCAVLLVAAAGCSEPAKEKRGSDQLIAKVESLGGEAMREPSDPNGPVRTIMLSDKNVDDNDLIELVQMHALAHLRTLDLSKTNVTGFGLSHLKGLPELETLDVGDTKVNDPDLEPLTSLPKLKNLGINGTQITDAAMEYIKAMPGLETLDLSNTPVDDAGIGQLKDLKHLTTLELRDTKVTDAGIDALKKSLPDCTIER